MSNLSKNKTFFTARRGAWVPLKKGGRPLFSPCEFFARKKRGGTLSEKNQSVVLCKTLGFGKEASAQCIPDV